MTITVNTASRTAVLASPAVFAAGEATPVTITGTTATLASLKLLLILTDGTELALCTTWTESPPGTFAGTLDLRTEAVDTAFDGKRPDERIPAILALGDASRLWINQGVEVTGNPLAVAPVAPDPNVFLSSSMFADVADLGADPTAGEIKAKLIEILGVLKQS
jgi:hypothetical protein